MTVPSAPRGARILVLAQLVKAGALFLGVTVLSRLLSPAEFGLVAVPLAIVGVGELLRDLGLSTAATTRPNLSAGLRNTLFWVNVVVAVLAAGVVVIGAPLVALALDEPAIALALPWLSLVFLINGLGAQYRADLNRQMRFRGMALTDALGALFGVAVAIAMALFGASYWALVVQPIAQAAAATIISVALCRWLPGRPQWDAEASSMIRFGAHVAGSQALMYLGNNVDTFALGYFVNSTQLGYYTRGYEVAIRPFTLLKAPATSIALPLMSRRRDDPAGFLRAVLHGQRLVAYTIVPAALLLAACAGPAVALLMGPQWAPAVPVIAIIAIGSAFQQLASVANWMFLAANKGGALSRYSVVSLIIKVIAVAVAAPFGILPVAIAYLAAAAVSAPIVIVWACRATETSLAAVGRGMLVPVSVMTAAAATTAAVGTLTVGLPAIAGLAIGIAVFAGVYALAAVIPAVRRDLTTVARILLRRGA